jgi:hypothetical protein
MLPTRIPWLLGIAASLVVSLTCSSIAMAAEERPHYIKKGVEINTELNGKGTIGEFFIEGKIGIGETTVLCEGVDNSIKIGAKWKSKLTIEFTKCSVFFKGEKVANCAPDEPITIALRDQLIYKNGLKTEEILDIFYPATGKTFLGSTFATVIIEGSGCGVLEGVYKVTGSAIAVMTPNKSGEETTEKMLIKFNGKTAPTGNYFNRENEKTEVAGKLLFDSTEANLKGAITQELESKEKFGVF